MASLTTVAGSLALVTGTSFTANTFKSRLVVAGTPTANSNAMTGFTAATGSTDQTVTSPTVTANLTSGRVVFDCADFSWTGLSHTGNVTHVIVYADGANDAARLPVFVVDVTDLALTPSITSANYAIPADGLGYIQS